MENFLFSLIFELVSTVGGGILTFASFIALCSGDAKDGVFFMLLIGVLLISIFVFMLKKEKKLREKGKYESTYTILTVVRAILIVVAIYMFFGFSASEPSKKQEKLSDEEIEWLEENYGNGKMEDINDALKEYKSK